MTNAFVLKVRKEGIVQGIQATLRNSLKFQRDVMHRDSYKALFIHATHSILKEDFNINPEDVEEFIEEE